MLLINGTNSVSEDTNAVSVLINSNDGTTVSISNCTTSLVDVAEVLSNDLDSVTDITETLSADVQSAIELTTNISKTINSVIETTNGLYGDRLLAVCDETTANINNNLQSSTDNCDESVSNSFASSATATTGTISNSRCSIVEQASPLPSGESEWIGTPPDPDAEIPINPQNITTTVPVKDVYTMENTIITTLDDEVTEIHLDDIKLSVNSDSFAWNFSAVLIDPDQKSLVVRDEDGGAKIIRVTINGYLWRLLVEKVSTTRRFGETAISINGRGLTALLAAPYVLPESASFGLSLTNQQIVNSVLPYDWGESIWEYDVWSVDGGAYSYQNKTIAEVLIDIAKMIGASIVPSRDASEVRFKKRYPVLPWEFADSNPDIEIPDAAVIELTEEPTTYFNANSVYVHGTDIGGVLSWIRFNGESGDRPATTASNAFMTDTTATRVLGERLLAGQHEQPVIKDFTTFMDGVDVPLIEVGNLIDINIDGESVRGVANSISIDATHLEVTQRITIGETTDNDWIAFNELLPKDPLLIGTLLETDGTTSLMELVDGGEIRIRGTGSVDSKYYIKSGEITGSAPDLPFNESLIY